MSWLAFSVLSVIFFTALNIIQRVIAIESKNSRALALVFNMTAGSIAFVLFLMAYSMRTISLPNKIEAWLWLLLAVLFYGLFERGRFVAAKYLEASVFTTISNISVATAFILALFLYNEALTTTKLLGCLLIFGALLIVSINKNIKGIVSKKGVLIGIGVSVALGLAWSLDKLGTQYFGADLYNIFVWTLPMTIIFFPRIKLEDLKVEFKLASWKIFLLALLNVLGYIFTLKALELAEATKVIPIVQTSTIFTVFLGIFLLNEKENIGKKIFASILAIIGAYFLI